MKKNIYLKIFLGVFLFLYMFVFFTNVKTSITVDEDAWVRRGTAFARGLRNMDWAATYQSAVPERTHPGVTLMTIETGGVAINKIFKNDAFIDTYGRIKFAVIVSSLFILGIITYLWLSFFKKDKSKLIFIGFTMLLFLEPMFIGTLKRVHLDALLGLFSMLSLTFLIYWLLKKDNKYLIFFYIVFTLSVLTKVPGLVILPFAGALVFIKNLIYDKKNFYPNALVSLRKTLYFLSLGIFFFLLLSLLVWPIMWIKPFFAIKGMFGSIFHNVVVPHDETLGYSLEPFFYINAFYEFTSPLFVMVSVISIIFSIFNIKKLLDRKNFPFTVSLAFSFFFILVMTIGAKKGERYIMPAFVSLAFANAFVLSNIMIVLLQRFRNKAIGLIVTILIIFLLIVVKRTFSIHPYYLAYYSPLVPSNRLQNLKIGLGEGLELAANYLDQKNEKITVASWYEGLYYQYANDNQKILDIRTYLDHSLKKTIDYVVTYRNMYGRENSHYATIIIKDLEKNYTPEHIIYINKIPYVWVYKIK